MERANRNWVGLRSSIQSFWAKQLDFRRCQFFRDNHHHRQSFAVDSLRYSDYRFHQQRFGAAVGNRHGHHGSGGWCSHKHHLEPRSEWQLRARSWRDWCQRSCQSRYRGDPVRIFNLFLYLADPVDRRGYREFRPLGSVRTNSAICWNMVCLGGRHRRKRANGLRHPFHSYITSGQSNSTPRGRTSHAAARCSGARCINCFSRTFPKLAALVPQVPSSAGPDGFHEARSASVHL